MKVAVEFQNNISYSKPFEKKRLVHQELLTYNLIT